MARETGSKSPLLALALATLALAAAPPATGDSSLTPVWRLDGERNTVYLLGSIHLLREQDYPLGPALSAAYSDAEALIMEIDLDDLDPAEAAAVIERRAKVDGGATLADWLGDETWRDARRLADAAGFSLDAFADREPWFVAMALTQMAMVRHGYLPQHGVDVHLAERAAADGKPLEGLESFDQQIGFFDGLSRELQRDLLLTTLADLGDYSSDMSAMVSAWKTGDTDYLEDELLSELAAFPELYEVLVRRRSEAWLPVIESLVGRDDDYLVVVGTLHLVGPDGLPALLSERGHDVTQTRATH